MRVQEIEIAQDCAIVVFWYWKRSLYSLVNACIYMAEWFLLLGNAGLNSAVVQGPEYAHVERYWVRNQSIRTQESLICLDGICIEFVKRDVAPSLNLRKLRRAAVYVSDVRILPFCISLFIVAFIKLNSEFSVVVRLNLSVISSASNVTARLKVSWLFFPEALYRGLYFW